MLKIERWMDGDNCLNCVKMVLLHDRCEALLFWWVGCLDFSFLKWPPQYFASKKRLLVLEGALLFLGC